MSTDLAASAPEKDDRSAILIADDYPGNLAALQAALEPLGEPIDAVDSGAKVLTALEGRDYAIALLDVQMPPLNGPEVARRIRMGVRNAEVPIMFLTAMEADLALVQDAYASGAVDFVQKPFDARILRSKVSVFVELHRRGKRIERETAARVREEIARNAAEAASREKDRFLSILGHELRTPLSTILLWSGRLMMSHGSADLVTRAIEAIHRNARTEAHIVDNVLEATNLVGSPSRRPERDTVDLSEIVSDVITELSAIAAAQGTRVAWTGSEGGHLVRGDSRRFRILVYNLIDNAVKFSPDARVDVMLRDDGRMVVFEVRDSGVGFPEGVGRELFRLFAPGDSSRSRAHGGLGLGLAVSKGIAEAYGGTIAGTSAGRGQGALFRVTLPRDRPASENSSTPGQTGGRRDRN